MEEKAKLEENATPLEEGKDVGGELATDVSLEEGNTETEKKGGIKQTLAFIGLILGIVVIVGGLAFAVLMFLSPPKKNTATTQKKVNSQTTYQSQYTQTQTYANTNTQSQTYLRREEIEKIKENLREEIENRLNQKIEEVKSEFETELTQKINELNKDLENLKNEVENVKANNRQKAKELKKIKEKIRTLEKKLIQLKQLSNPVIQNNYSVLGSINVDEITKDYINIDGTNYWIGDKITILVKNKPKEFTITKINPKGNYIILQDIWGNKYLLKVKESLNS